VAACKRVLCETSEIDINIIVYLGINDFRNNLPLADLSCFSLIIADFLSGDSSEYIIIQGRYLDVKVLFVVLL
jgi:hypothetical protein